MLALRRNAVHIPSSSRPSAAPVRLDMRRSGSYLVTFSEGKHLRTYSRASGLLHRRRSSWPPPQPGDHTVRSSGLDHAHTTAHPRRAPPQRLHAHQVALATRLPSPIAWRTLCRTPPRRLDVRGDTSGFALCFCAVVAHRRTHAHMHMHTRAHTRTHTHLHPFAYRRAPSALSGSWRNALCASSQHPRRARRWGRVAVLSGALAADWPT